MVAEFVIKKFGDKYRRKDTENNRAIFPELLFVTALPLIRISLSAFHICHSPTGEEAQAASVIPGKKEGTKSRF